MQNFISVKGVKIVQRHRLSCNVCGQRAIITKSVKEHQDLTKLYCSCKNLDCAHRFVMNLEFSHSIHPSKLDEKTMYHYILKNLPDDKKQEILKILSA